MTRVRGIDHVAIAVKDLKSSLHFLCDILGGIHHLTKVNAENNSEIAYVTLGKNLITLLHPLGEGRLKQHIDSKGEGVHHVALEVSDLDNIAQLISKSGIGVPQLSETSERREFMLHDIPGLSAALEIIEWKPEFDLPLNERMRLLAAWEVEKKRDVMVKQVIHVDSLPKSKSPLSQAVRMGNLVFCSGITAKDPATGKVIIGSFEQQAINVLQSIEKILLAAGSSWEKVLKVTVFLINIENKPVFDACYSRFVSQYPPARSCIEVSKLEPGVEVEVEVIAYA
jgi:2-iminobutanoate/2-iminopropanoate deaminase